MMDWLGTFAQQAPLPALILCVLWFLLRDVRRDQTEAKNNTAAIAKRLDCIENSQHACQLENAKVFATKTDIGEAWKRLDNHESRISRMEGRQ